LFYTKLKILSNAYVHTPTRMYQRCNIDTFVKIGRRYRHTVLCKLKWLQVCMVWLKLMQYSQTTQGLDKLTAKKKVAFNPYTHTDQ